MQKFRLPAIVLISSFSLLAAACNGDRSGSGDTRTKPMPPTQSSPSPGTTSPTPSSPGKTSNGTGS